MYWRSKPFVFSFEPRCQGELLPRRMGIAEVDGDAGSHGEVRVAGHLTSLIPGDGAGELQGQLPDGFAHSRLDALGSVVVGEVEEQHKAGGALDQGSDGRLVTRPED
jgi:hypothetical protein